MDGQQHQGGKAGHAGSSARAREQALRAGGTEVARREEARALTHGELERRRLIHPAMEDVQQVDTFRELRTRLQLPMAGEHQVTVVTGVGPGCGASFVARNLASAIAFEEGRGALLIDCNLRRPSLGRDFGVESDAGGLVEFLDKPAIGLSAVIHSTGVPRLQVLPAGGQRPGGEYFSTFRMRALVDMLRTRYPDKFLVLDAPPAVGSPDARILAELADAVLLVAGEGRHRPEAISEAARRFPPAKLAGVVFNQLP